jgi:hypothetical protein
MPVGFLVCSEMKKAGKFCPLYYFSVISSGLYFLSAFAVLVMGTCQDLLRPLVSESGNCA